MKKVFFIYILLLIINLFSGCVSMSTLQTAKTLPEGESQQTFGGGSYVSQSVDSNNKSIETKLPYFEYTARYGFYEGFDAGIKLTFLGSYTADIKYNLLNLNQFALASGAGIGYQSYTITSGEQETKVSYTDFIVPLYLSYDFNEYFSLYMSPKFIYRKGSGADTSSDSIKGLGIGTKLGQKKGVYLEAAVFQGQETEKMTQYNISYFW